MTQDKKHHAPEKQPAGQSKKAHIAPPPKELGSHGAKPWGGERGAVGEFTGQGSPGLQKK